jgi:hypothetical protein
MLNRFIFKALQNCSLLALVALIATGGTGEIGIQKNTYDFYFLNICWKT